MFAGAMAQFFLFGSENKNPFYHPCLSKALACVKVNALAILNKKGWKN